MKKKVRKAKSEKERYHTGRRKRGKGGGKEKEKGGINVVKEGLAGICPPGLTKETLTGASWISYAIRVRYCAVCML